MDFLNIKKICFPNWLSAIKEQSDMSPPPHSVRVSRGLRGARPPRDQSTKGGGANITTMGMGIDEREGVGGRLVLHVIT